jgi:hypothetical protein
MRLAFFVDSNIVAALCNHLRNKLATG